MLVRSVCWYWSDLMLNDVKWQDVVCLNRRVNGTRQVVGYLHYLLKLNYYLSCRYWSVPFSEVLRIGFWTVREEKKLQVKYFICKNWSDIFRERSILLEVLTNFPLLQFNKRIDLLFWFSVNSIDWKPWAFSERSAMIWLGLKVFNDLLTRERRMHGAWEESSGSLDDFGYNMLRDFLKALV